MGEFDKCHICIGLVRYLGFIFGILVNIYVIYAPISPITLAFGFLNVDCRFLWFKPSIWEKYENESKLDED
jgi:hypothetical protein